MTRHFWVLVHRYAGLYMAFFLLVAGLTGSILAFTPEISHWLNPPAKVTQQAWPRLDEFTLHERAEALYPNCQVNSINFNRKPDEAYTAFLEPRIDPATGKPYELAFNMLLLDPYTGEIISMENRVGDIWPINRKNFLSLVVRLHYQLALPGSLGTWLFGIAALIWTLDCFVSAYLTFPLSVRRKQLDDLPREELIKLIPPMPFDCAQESVRQAHHERNQYLTVHPELVEGLTRRFPRKSWWLRWLPSWLVKWRASAFRVNFDLHRAGGLWVWLMLLVLAWSSVGFNLNEQVYLPVMKAAFDMPDPFGELPGLEKPATEPALSWREAQRIGRQLMAEQAKIQGFSVLREEALQYVAEKGVFFYIVSSDRDLMSESAGTWLILDGSSGKFAGINIPTGQNAGSTINNWLFALHMAMIWGLPYKIFLSIVGIVIAMLSITGVYIWLKKRQARRYSKERQGKLMDKLNA